MEEVEEPEEVDPAKKKKGKGKGKGKGGAAPEFNTKELSKMMMDMNKLLLAHDDSICSMEAYQLRTLIMPTEAKSMVSGRAESTK